jgi:hypothetical protein
MKAYGGGGCRDPHVIGLGHRLGVVSLSLCLIKQYTMKEYGAVEAEIHMFLASVTGWEWSVSRPSHFISDPLDRGPDGPQSRFGGRDEKILLLLGLEFRTLGRPNNYATRFLTLQRLKAVLMKFVSEKSRIPGYRSKCSGSIPGATRFYEK